MTVPSSTREAAYHDLKQGRDAVNHQIERAFDLLHDIGCQDNDEQLLALYDNLPYALHSRDATVRVHAQAKILSAALDVLARVYDPRLT